MTRKETHQHIPNPLITIGFCLASASTVLSAGCASSGSTSSAAKGNVTVITLPNEGERIAAAQSLAIAAQSAKNTTDAINLYHQAVEQYPDLPAAWNNLGVLLLGEGRLMEASEAFNSAAASAPNDPRPYFNLGLTWDRAGYLETALEHYSRALTLDERYLPALRGAIKTESRLGNASPILVQRIQHALLLEQDPKWREYFELQRSWAEAEVRAKAGLPTAGAAR